MPSRLLDLARKFSAQLDAQDERALNRLVDAYRLMYDRLQGRVDALLLEIERDAITKGGVAKLARYRDLMAQIEREVERYANYLQTELELSTSSALQLGLTHSQKLALAALEEAGITARFNSLPTNAVKKLLAFLQDGSPLYNRIDALAGVQAQRVRDALLEGIGLGFNPRKVAAAIRDAFGMGLTDALRMTRTADLWAYREAARANYAASNVVTGWVWAAEKDGDTCAACLAEDGSIHELSEPLDGHYNCVLPDTEVTSLRLPTAAISRWYDGEIICLETRGGKFLRVTPNHPILTRRGWVAAKDLKPIDDVICYSRAEGAAPGVHPDKDHGPTSIEDIFLAPGMNRLATVPSTPQDFHGDGMQGEIHVVRPDSLLGSEAFAPFIEPLPKEILGGAALELWMSLAPFSGLYKAGDGTMAAANGIMRRLGITSVLGGRSCSHHQTIGVQWPANGYLMSDEDLAYYATASVEAFGNGVLAVPVEIQHDHLFLGELVLDHIDAVVRKRYSGHVYNLETENGWYISNSIITHNCRCAPIPYIEGMSEEPQTGEAWFKEQDEATQRGILGPGKYDAWTAGKFDFAALVSQVEDDTYGTMRVETPLKDLVSE